MCYDSLTVGGQACMHEKCVLLMKKKQYFQKGRTTVENIAKRFVEKYPLPIAVYKNNIHKSGINLNSRFSDRQKNAQKCIWFK